MRKLIAYIITALLLAVSCVSELEQGGPSVDGSLEGAPVMITFSVPDIPVLSATKSLESGDGDITDTPYLDPEKIYVVVCGGTQSIKYIRKAILVDQKETVVPKEIDPLPAEEDEEEEQEKGRKVNMYYFKVQLELSDTPRTFHILGNVDENQFITGTPSYSSLPNMLSFENKQAYWQKIVVPHIKAKLNKVTGKPEMDGSCFVPDDESAGYFQYIPLIRNFAMIQVTNVADNFKLHSYAVIFHPEEGSAVPFRSNAMDEAHGYGFEFNPPSGYLFSGYEKCAFEDLEKMNYLGNMPSVALNQDIPEAEEFEDPSTSLNGRVIEYYEDENLNKDNGFYIFERGIPDDNVDPTFIIICGKFENEDDYYYYRLDLMETKVEGTQSVSKYYPIYRNFRYNIQLHRISSEGVKSPKLAATSSGIEDISADVSMRHLSDISNGTTRLVVEPFMTRTYSGPSDDGYYELYARFFDNVYSDEPDMLTSAVWVELEPMSDGSDNILILYDDNGNSVPAFFPKANEDVGGVKGIRIIRFNTVEPLNETKTQKIKITGRIPGSLQDQRLYREVEITLQNKQPLKVSCTTPVQTFTNIPITVDITIPSVLPESMFPLEFIVEPEARTLTPDTSKNINMPVVSGRSIATTEGAFTDNPTFYYIRTLTWEEFKGLPLDGDKRTFQCFFKTNRDFNATTIWVYNEYFTKDKAAIENKMSLSLSCTDPVVAAEGTPVTVELTVHSGMPQDMFPLNFIVEPEDATLTPDNSKGVELDKVVGYSIATDVTEYKDTKVYQYIRTLEWSEYSNLPVVNGNQRTFYCYFKTTVDESATTIWAYHPNVYKAHVSFENQDKEPDNHFWVEAIENCTVKINYSELQYKIDDGGWVNYGANNAINLTAGQRVSFKAKKQMTRTNDDAFHCTGGNFKVGGNFASLMVGDNYPGEGAGKTGDRFINFFKAHDNLVDAYELVLPMTSLSVNGYKSMFDSCTNLKRGPKELPAMNLNTTCYRNMFYGCSSLEYAPALPATKLVSGCYQRLFWGCSKLNHIKMMGKNWQKDAFISDNTNWCAGVASEGTIECNSDIQTVSNWNTTWKTIIPAEWSVNFE